MLSGYKRKEKGNITRLLGSGPGRDSDPTEIPSELIPLMVMFKKSFPIKHAVVRGLVDIWADAARVGHRSTFLRLGGTGVCCTLRKSGGIHLVRVRVSDTVVP